MFSLEDFSIQSSNIVLRALTDEQLVIFAGKAAGNILAKDQQNFFTSDWALLPSPEFEESFINFHRMLRQQMSPQKWTLVLGIFIDQDTCVGLVSICAENYAQNQTVETTSWLLKSHQGQGIGSRARRAILHFIFHGMDAHKAISGAHVDNEASNRISKNLGYILTDQKLENMSQGTALINHYEIDNFRAQGDVTLRNTGIILNKLIV